MAQNGIKQQRSTPGAPLKELEYLSYQLFHLLLQFSQYWQQNQQLGKQNAIR